MTQRNISKRKIRHHRIRSKISGFSSRPRLSVFRSNLHMSAQLIDDVRGVTLCSVSDREIKGPKSSRIKIAFEAGKLLAKKASENNIENVVFDRGGYAYHGLIKALAEGAREGGLKF